MKIGEYETHPAADLFPLLPPDELDALAASIKANGLRHPVALFEGKILDGRNRALACEKAGVALRTVDVIGVDPWDFSWDTNVERRHLPAGQRAALALISAERKQEWHAERERAREQANRARAAAAKGNQHAAKPANSRASREAPPSASAPRQPDPVPAAPVRVRDNAAKEAAKASAALAQQAGVSRATMERVGELQRKAPESFAQVAAGTKELGQALKEVKRAEVVARVAATAPAPDLGEVKPAPVIYADPPWSYDNTSSAGAVADQYGTMPLADICALKIPATRDAVLFMWATSPLLPEAFEVLRAWGFQYKASLVWDKGSGTGNWVLNAHEMLLIAVRGNIPCPLPANRPVSVVRAPRTRHSEKPAEFAALIRRMYPEFERVEMFCRKPSEGFRAWGNQVEAA